MRLAPRLVLAFGFLATASTAGLGLYVREDRTRAEARRFDDEVRSACTSVKNELVRQAESDRKLVAGACQKGELVDRVAIAIERGDALEEMMLGYHDLVPREREAFGFEELMLATSQGDVIGADPHALLALPRADVERALAGLTAQYSIRTSGTPAVVSRCITRLPSGATVGLVGAHHVTPQLERLGKVLGVAVSLGPPQSTDAAAGDTAQASCSFADAASTQVSIYVTKRKTQLKENVKKIDRAILAAAFTSAAIALVLAVLLARNLGRPLAELADEARKVAAEEARPLRVRGSGEIADLVQAFDKMIVDLASTRRRLAATSRVAAWREVARRVAHEVKNPLAPIRAAVETLRRLRARQDPAFDEYFDEATRTVLDEVHRISNIVTEFTRFARLPPPRPQEVDVEELVRHVVGLHKSSAEGTAIEPVTRRAPPRVRADRDQVVQVLTNLVQNALDAVKATKGARIAIAIDGVGGAYASITVSDNGPGIAPEIEGRLFEPYATTKSTGTGLGLAIAQRIAIEHKGELSYLGALRSGDTPDTPGGRGAIFRLVLPVDGPPPASEAPASD
jgi:signal transduction histidine kinase